MLLRETLDLLAPERGGLFVDATVGLGGHAEALLRRAPAARLVGFDRDPEALRRAAARLEPFGGRVRLAQGNFHRFENLLAELGVQRGAVAGALFDLGVSSLQLGTPERGFSFRLAGPLDMRMGLSELTAADLVNQSAEGDLEKIFRDFGEERQARRIARAIVDARSERPITTTAELKSIIDQAKGGGRQGRGGTAGLRDLARGEIDQVTGRSRSESQLLEVLTRKPLRPTPEEVASNPRSRSARLRAAKRM